MLVALEEVKKVVKLRERRTVIPAGKKFGDADIIARKHLDIREADVVPFARNV